MVLRIAIASPQQRQTIYGLRHEIYARELGQHRENAGGEIHDGLDDGTYEVRILTVLPEHRGTSVAFLLMYAAFR